MSKEDVPADNLDKQEETAEDDDPFESLEADETTWDDGEEVDEAEVSESSDDETESSDEVEESQEQEVEENQPESEEDTASEVEQKKSEDTSEESKDEPENKSNDELAQEAFKRREAERKLREEREARERQDLNAYLEAAKDDEDEFNKRQIEVERHLLNKERASVLEQSLDVRMRQAVSELGLKNADVETKQFIARQLDKFEQGNVLRDKNGQIQEIRGDVYQYIKDEMDSISAFRSIGAREQKQKKAVEKSRTVVKPTRTPKESPKDADLDFFDKEFYGE